jgi:hypothetical protein
MSCSAEYGAYLDAAVDAGLATAAVAAELDRGVGAPVSLATTTAAIAATAVLIASGMSYSNCLENDGKLDEARLMREEMDVLQREVDRLHELVGTS